MRVPVRPVKRGAAFNITPMIDVVFNLVIFFLVASHFARNEASEPVALPTATQAQAEDEDPRRVVITIQADGGLSVKGHTYSAKEVEAIIREGAGDDPAGYAVRFRADKQSRFASVEPLMKTCAKLGITQVGFNVIERSE